jgi:hypothetical protein
MSYAVQAEPSVVTTLDGEHVLIKTVAGLRALQTRNPPPPARMAALLRLADGKHNVAQIVQTDGQSDVWAQLTQMMQLGWLQVYVATDTQPVPVIPTPSQNAAATPPAVSEESLFNITAAQRSMVDWAVKALGLDSSTKLALQIERSYTRAELLVLLERMCSQFSGIMSREAISLHQQEALILLGARR